MIRVLFALFMLILCIALPAQVTLDDCIRSGLQNNPALRMVQNEALVSAEELFQARAAALPSLDFSGTYRRQSDVPEFSVPPVTTPLGPITLFPGGMALGVYDNYDFRLTLSQPLFTGFRIANRKAAADEMLQSKKLETVKNRNELIYKIKVAYAQVLKAGKMSAIARVSRDQVKTHLSDVATLVEQGLARKDDLLKTEVSLSEAELAVLRAENGVRLARAALENLIGEPLSPTDSLAALTILPMEPVVLDAAIQQALAQRPELQMLGYVERAGLDAVKIARGGRLPSIAAFGTFGYGKPGLDFIKKEWMDYWLLGAGAEWNLWTWGKTRSQVQQAQIKANTVTETIRQAVQAVTFDVTEAHLRLQEAQQSLRLMADAVNLAAASFRNTENNYRQGQAGHTDFFDAQSQWARIRLQAEQTEIDLALAQANWQRAVGATSPQE